MKPELQKLFEGVNGLSTDFLDKVSGLLESKVEAARVTAIQETEAAGHQERLALVEAHKVEIDTLKESHIEEVATKVDAFLNAVVEEWANKNAPAIDSQIKREASEKLLSGLVGVMKEARINFAEDSDGMLAVLNHRLSETERDLNEANSQLATIKESETSRQREDVIKRVCEGMVATKKELVIGLLEGIDFKTEAEFESRVRTFRNLTEGKAAKKEGDDKDKDDNFSDKVGKDNEKDKKVEEGKNPKKEGDDDNDDDSEDDKDDTDKELKEAVARQIAAVLKG